MKSCFLFVFVILMVTSAKAQHSSNSYIDLADSLYAHHHYQFAVSYYEKALKKAQNSGEIMLKMGRSYAKLNEIKKAEEWFSKAKSNKAAFDNKDAYLYAQVLAMQEKRIESESLLKDIVSKNPYALKEREFLSDLLHYRNYYKDSAQYVVKSLPINTSVSEFAPAYYKDGIVYASATPEHAAKRKYHWDNSHYLNLFYSKIVGTQFQKPAFFERELNTRFHDGPAVFYNNFSSMIVNRNQKNLADSTGRDLWHLGLLDAQYSNDKSSWQVSPLPFDQAAYSFLHPSISEDGNVLYFVSDKPGGYGGSDIYRANRLNGTWTEPFNLGPSINTDENEVFPFMIEGTLYFASRGHGGLGGLDIYRSEQTVNGFLPPVNLGYPINSPKDDFSIILSNDLRTGYFASSRSGNDDLYSFEKVLTKVPMMVHTYDGVTNESLGGASVQVICATANDISLITDGNGNFKFSLPDGTDYIVIATKDDKVGMLSGVAAEDYDRHHLTHQLPAFADTARVPCIGAIKDKDGAPVKASTIAIFDVTSNREVARLENNSLANFSGEKDHEYRVEIRNERGDTTIHKVHIGSHDAGMKTWTMVLKETSPQLTMAARIFKEEDGQPLAGALVEVITFSEPNLQLAADEDGKVEFALPSGTTYLLIGSNANYSGMHSGVVEKGLDKTAVVHPVPAYGDKLAVQNKLIVGLITDGDGKSIAPSRVYVKDNISGDSVPVTIKDGLLHFKGEKGKSYMLSVDHEGYTPFREEITLTEDAKDVEKISVVLKKDLTFGHLNFAARVFRDADKQSLQGAQVTIISFSSADQELLTGSDGVADYTLEKGAAYLVVARKDSLFGNFIGTADKEFTKELVIHPVPTFYESGKHIPVVAQIIDRDRNLISTATTTIIEQPNGEQIPLQAKGSMISFVGEPGKSYSVKIEDKDYKPVTHLVTVSESTEKRLEKISLLLEKMNTSIPDYTMGVKVIKEVDKSGLAGAKVVVISFSEPDQEFTASEDGSASFSISEGSEYMVVGSKDGYLGMLVGSAEKGKDKSNMIHLIEAKPEREKFIPVVSQIIDQNGHKIKEAEVMVLDSETKNEIASTFHEGFLTYLGEKGKKYDVAVKAAGNAITDTHAIQDGVGLVDKFSIAVPLSGTVVPDKPIARKSAASSGRRLIVFQTDQGATQVYLNDDDTFAELVESNGQLYLQRSDTTERLGSGQLLTIASNMEVLKQLQITESEIIKLQNVYFDFNKAQLDDADKLELEKVSKVLKNFKPLQLVIRAHADDRGQDTYNLSLSRKRARAVGAYLIKAGISKTRIIQEALGETLPQVPCATRDCSEDEHQQNRRAEFLLHSTKIRKSIVRPKVETTTSEINNKATPTPVGEKTSRGYDDILQQFGDRKIEGLKIKISVGVYRFNSTLTFHELKDLGKIEVVNGDGTTYYFLSEFLTLNEAESAKVKVAERGIKDAYLTFHYKGRKIKMKEVIKLHDSSL